MWTTDEEFDNAHRCTECGVTGGGVEDALCEECFTSELGYIGQAFSQIEHKVGE